MSAAPFHTMTSYRLLLEKLVPMDRGLVLDTLPVMLTSHPLDAQGYVHVVVEEFWNQPRTARGPGPAGSTPASRMGWYKVAWAGEGGR